LALNILFYFFLKKQLEIPWLTEHLPNKWPKSAV